MRGIDRLIERELEGIILTLLIFALQVISFEVADPGGLSPAGGILFKMLFGVQLGFFKPSTTLDGDGAGVLLAPSNRLL